MFRLFQLNALQNAYPVSCQKIRELYHISAKCNLRSPFLAKLSVRPSPFPFELKLFNKCGIVSFRESFLTDRALSISRTKKKSLMEQERVKKGLKQISDIDFNKLRLNEK